MLPSLAPGLLLVAAPQPAPVPIVPREALSPPVTVLNTPETGAERAEPAPPATATTAETRQTGSVEDPAAQSATQDPAPSVETPEVEKEYSADDPLEKFNRGGFAVHQELDKLILRPVSMGYKHVVPKPVRAGIRNFLLNLTEPIVFLNDLLQLRPDRAMRTLARFVVDSTLGLAGVFDVAKRPDFNLPHHPNGFGDTLGYYGIKPGPYLFLPLVGPTDLRDLAGGGANGVLLPLAVGRPFNKVEYQVATGVAGGIDERAQADQDLRTLFDSAVDPYATLRSVYLQDRAAEIRALKKHGNGAETKGPLDQQNTDPLAPPLADPAAASAKTTAPAAELDDPLADPAAPAQTRSVQP